jgi:hypothetical protein
MIPSQAYEAEQAHKPELSAEAEAQSISVSSNFSSFTFISSLQVK